MTAATDYLEGQLRGHIFRTATFAKPAALHVRLFTAMPGEAGGGTEVVGGVGYAPVQRNPLDANWTAASATDGETTNAAVLQYGAPTGNWGVVVGMSLDDAAAAGNMLIYMALTQSKTVNSGDAAPSFPAGNISVTFA